METRKINIRTKTGKEITRNATVETFLESSGKRVSVATVGKTRYGIVDHDYYGPIWMASKSI